MTRRGWFARGRWKCSVREKLLRNAAHCSRTTFTNTKALFLAIRRNSTAHTVMVTTRRQSVGEISRPQEAVVQSSPQRKRSRAGDEPASKRRRSDEGTEDSIPAETMRTKGKGSRDRKAKPRSSQHGHKINIDTQATGSKPGHVRFDSEEPEQAEIILPEDTQANIMDDTDEDEDESDEAPEDMTAADAQATSTAAQRQAARAVEQQHAKARKKRQEREQRLQEQAKISSKKNRHKAAELPDLLPEDVLADEPFARPPTPPPTEPAQKQKASEAMSSKAIKFHDNKPKDIRVGPVTVSVLEKQNKLLPPKAHGRAKSVKDQWLAGRRGSGMTRQSFNGGFLRS